METELRARAEHDMQDGKIHGRDVLVAPFHTHHTTEHCILMWEGESWLMWRHPDGQWVTETKVALLQPTNPAYDSPDGWWLRLSGEQRLILYGRYPEMGGACSSVPDSGADEHPEADEKTGYELVYEKISVAEESLGYSQQTVDSGWTPWLAQGNLDFMADFLLRTRHLMADYVDLCRNHALLRERPDIYADTSPREHAEPVTAVHFFAYRWRPKWAAYWTYSHEYYTQREDAQIAADGYCLPRDAEYEVIALYTSPREGMGREGIAMLLTDALLVAYSVKDATEKAEELADRILADTSPREGRDHRAMKALQEISDVIGRNLQAFFGGPSLKEQRRIGIDLAAIIGAIQRTTDAILAGDESK